MGSPPLPRGRYRRIDGNDDDGQRNDIGTNIGANASGVHYPPVLDPGFVADCPYAPEAILFDEILDVDREAGRVAARMSTHDRLPFTALQRVHPERHPRHVSGAVMVHVTAMLGFAHAYFVLGLRHAEGWIGYGTHIASARYGRLAT